MSLVTKASSPNVKMRNQMLLDNKSDLKNTFAIYFYEVKTKRKKIMIMSWSVTLIHVKWYWAHSFVFHFLKRTLFYTSKNAQGFSFVVFKVKRNKHNILWINTLKKGDKISHIIQSFIWEVGRILINVNFN